MLPALLLTACLALASASTPLPKYIVNLDLAPEQRYEGLFSVPGTDYNATVWKFYNEYFVKYPPLMTLLSDLTTKRGPEPDEQQREINGLAAMSGLPVDFVQGIQMLYELQTVMVPVVNFTKAEGKEFPTIEGEWRLASSEALLWRSSLADSTL